VFNGGVLTTGTGGGNIFSKAGTGTLTWNTALVGNASTITTSLDFVAGTLEISNLANSIGAMAGITFNNTTVGAALNYTGVGESSSKTITLSATTGPAFIFANQSTATNPLILSSFSGTFGAGAKVLVLGGRDTQANEISAVISQNSGTNTTSITKTGAGNWTLSGANTNTGGLTVAGGKLTLKASASGVTDIYKATGAVTFNADGVTALSGHLGTQSAGGILQFDGFTGGSQEALGALTTTAGHGQVVIGGTTTGSTLTFASLVARTAGSTLDLAPGGTSGIGFTATVTGTGGIFNGATTYNGVDWVAAGTGPFTAAPYNGYTTLVAGTVVGTNYRLTTGSITLTSNVSMNSLKLVGSSGTTTVTATGINPIATGGILFDNTGGTVGTPFKALITAAQIGAAATEVIVTTNGTGDSTSTLTIASAISSTTGSLTKAGSGTLVLSGASAFTGNVNINQGTVQLSGATARIGTSQVAATVFNLRQGATFDLNGAGGGSTTIGALNGAGSIINSGTSTLVIGNGATTTVANAAFTGTIGSAGLSLTKDGTGVQYLTGANTYGGVTTINRGTLAVTSLASGGNTSSIGNSSSSAANLVFNGGTLQYTGSNAVVVLATQTPSVATDRLFTLTASGGTIDSSGTFGNSFLATGVANNATLIFTGTGDIAFTGSGNRTLTLQGSSTGDNTLTPRLIDPVSQVSPVVTGTLALTKAGAGLWILNPSTSNTYTGVTTVNGSTTTASGVLQFADDSGAVNGISTGSNILLGNATGPGVLQSSGSFVRATGTGANQVQFGSFGGGFAASSSKLTVNLGGAGASLVLGTAPLANSLLVLSSSTALAEVELANALDLGSAARTVQVDDNVNTSTDYAIISGKITGIAGGTFTKTGSGNLVLTNATSDYVANTQVSAGTLTLTDIDGADGTSNLGTNAGKLILGAAGSTAVALNYVGAGETVNRAIDLNTTTGGITIDSSGYGALVLNGTFTTTATGTKTLTLTGANADLNEIRSVISNNGTVSLSKTGGGTWVLSGANTYSGTTSATNGILGVGADSTGTPGAVTSGPLGTGTLSFGTNTYGKGGLMAVGADRIILNNVSQLTGSTGGGSFLMGDFSLTFSGTFVATSGNSATLTNNITAPGKQVTFSGAMTMGNSSTSVRTLTIDGGGVTVLSGNISNVSGATTPAITYNNATGTGSLTLGGTNTYTGLTTLTAGTLNFANSGALNGAGGFTITAGTIDNTSGAGMTLANNALTLNGNFTFTGTNDLNLGTGATSISAGRTITVTAGTLTLGGAITGATFNITKAGAGTLYLKGDNSLMTGTVATINAGTLMIDNELNLGPVTNDVTWGGAGTLQVTTGFAADAGKVLTIGAFTGTIQVDAGTLTIGSAVASTVTTGTLVKSGAGDLSLTAASTALDGTLRVDAGNLVVNGLANVLGDTTNRVPLRLNGGNLVITSDTAGTFNNATWLDAVSSTITLNRAGAGAGVTHTMSGATLTVGALGATLNVVGGSNIDASSTAGLTFGAVTLSGPATFNITNPASATTLLTIGAVTTSTANSISVTGNGNFTAGGVVGGTGGTVNLGVAGNGTAFSGTATFTGANTFTGGVFVNSGTAVAGVSNATTVSGAFGPSTVAVRLGDSSGSNNASILANTFSVTNPITVVAGSAGNTLTIGNNGTTTGATFSGAITLANNLTITTTGSTGATTVSGGITGTGNLTLNAINNTAGTGITLSTATINPAGTITNSGASGAGATLISGTIGSNVTRVVQNSTTSSLTLSGANTFTYDGTTNFGLNIRAGTVNALTSASALGAGRVTLGDTTALNANPASLLFGTNSLTFTNPIVLADRATATGTLTIGITASTVGTVLSGGVTGDNDFTVVNSTNGGTGRPSFTSPVNNSGTITLIGTNAATTAATTFSSIGSNVTGITVSSTGYTPLTVTALAVNSGGTTLTNSVSGAGTLAVLTVSGGITGTGDLILNNNNSTITNAIQLTTSGANNSGKITNSGTGTSSTLISADIGSSVTNLTQNSATSALILSGANIAFTGALSVQAGSLTISGGATTAPTPTSLAVTNGASLSLANGAAQHFNGITGAITLGGTGTTTLAFELGSTSAYDRLTTSGAGSASGNVRFSLSGLSGFQAGTYDLLTSGSGTLNGATYSLSSAPGGYTYSVNSSATNVQLVATAAATGDTLYWRGGVNASWSALSGANTNWDLTSGGTSIASFNPGSTNTVTFSNSGAPFTSGSTIATTLDSAYAINALNFTGAPTGVSIVTIASGVGGTASSLTITPSLSSAGISVGANAGAVTISAPVVLGGAQTWSVDGTGANGSSLAISGAITGGSGATLAISGLVSLSAVAAANTYGGTTTIGDGGILMGTVAANLSANSAMVVNGTGILRLNGISNAVPSLAGNGKVQNNHASTAVTLTVGAANTSTTFSGVLQNGGVGTLALTKVGTGELTLSGTNTNTGNITVNGGTLNLTGSWTGNTTATTLIYGGTSTSPSVVNVSGNMTLFGHTGSNVSGGVGIYNQTAGTVDVTGNATTATYIAGAAGSYGYFNLTGGTFKERTRFAFGSTSNLATPSRSVAYIAGTLDQAGGEWMLNYSNAQITVAQGGTIDRTGASQPFGLMMNSTVTGGIYGVLNLAGGTVLTTTQPIRFGNSTTAGNGVNQTAIINLASGTLQVGTAMTISLPTAGANNAYLNFAGGTLKTSAAITDWIPASTGAITFTANVFGAINNSAVSGAPSFGGGLTFDTNGFDSSLLAVLRGPTGSGVTQSSLNVTGGTGYIGAPEVIFTGGTLEAGGSPAAGYALISGGVVTGIVITSPGDYTVAPTITLTGGGGTGASVSVGTLVANSAGGLTKTGAGTLTLSGINTYGGVTTISEGNVVLSSATATLGSTAAGTVVQNGAQLRLTATSFTLNEDLTLTGIGTSTTGAGVGALGMQVNSGVITYNGTITLDGGATLGTFNSGTATMTVAKGIAGTGDLTIRTGAASNGTANWILQGKSTYSGNTIFSTSHALGTVTIKNEIEDALPATSALSMNGTAGTASTVLTYVLNGFNQTVAGLSGTNGTTGSYTYQNTVVGGSATLSTLTVNNSADYSFGGTLGGTGANENNLALTKSGNGTLTLTGTNTYSGVTRVTGGALAFGADVNLGDTSATNTITLNGGSLSYTGAGNLPLNANQVATLGVSGGILNVTQSTGSLTLTGGIASASTGSLTKTGPGLVIIPGTTAWTAVIPAVTVSEGTLRAGFGTGGISALTVASAGHMDFTNSAAEVLTLGTTANALTLTGGAHLIFELGAPTTGDRIIVGTGGNALTSGGTITLDFINLGNALGAGTYDLLSDLSGSGLLTGGTTYALGNAPPGFNYTINQTKSLISLTVVNFNPIYWRNGQGGNSWNALGSGVANWTTDAAGATDATAVPGTLDTVIFSATSAPLSSTTITTTLDGNFTIDGLQFKATPTGVTTVTLNQGSAGTLTIAPSSTSSGISVEANAGNNVINAPLVASNANVSSQTWSVDGTGANGSSLTVAGPLTINALIAKTGAGALTLSGSNSGAGGLTLSAGTLNINSNTALGTGTFAIAAGAIINNTLGSSVNLTGTNPAMNWNGSFIFTGSNDLNLGTGAVILGGNATLTASASTLTVGGAISDASSTRSLTKDGAGTLVTGGIVSIGGNLAVTLGTGTFSGATNTIGGSVTASGTAFTMNGGTSIGAGLSVTAGTAIMNGANTITGSVAVTGGTLTLGGANTVSAGVSVTTGTLNLNGANTIASGVTLNSGSLNIGAAGALGSNAFTISGGTIDNTSGTAVTLSNNNVQSWNGSFTFTGTNSLNMGNGAVTLGASPTLTLTAGTLTLGGVIEDSASTFGLTKTGAGTLTLGAANTYGGTTVINQGTVNLNATQTLSASTNGLTFGTAAGNTNVVTLTLAAGVNATFGGTFLVQTDSASANTINIPTGQTMRLNGAVTVGYNSAANSTTKLTATGGGTLTFGAAGQPTNSSVQIGNGQTLTISNAATVDLTGLSTFYANLGTGTFRVGDPTTSGNTAGAGSTLLLAPNSTIVATTITSDSTSGSVTQLISLGSGANEFNANTITIGGSTNRGTGTLNFNGASGTLKIRNLAGTGRATMNVQNGSASTGSPLSGTVNLTERGSDLLLSTLTIGGRSGASTANGTGTFTYDTASGGGLDATTISVASRTGTTSTSGNVTGTLNIGANATITTLTMGTNSVALTTGSSTGDATANVTISGGTITIGTVTMGVNTVGAGFATGSDTITTLAISGGTTTVSTAFSMGAQNSANNAATTVNTATSTLNISAGSLILSGTVDLTMGSTTLDLNNVATATINLTGTGLLRVGGNITSAVFTGSTVTNTLNLDGGTLDMDVVGSLGATATPVVFNANSGTLMNVATINSTGGLTKTTAGVLILSGTTNGWTGDTVFAVGGGTIRLGSGTAIPDGTSKGGLVTTNGLVDLNGFSETVNGLSGTGTVDNLAASTTSVLTVGGNNAVSAFGGTLQSTGTGSVLSLVKTGTGTLTLSSANLHTGGTTISGGVILANNVTALGSGTLTISVSGIRLVVGNGLTIANAVIIGANSGVSGRGIIEADTVAATSTLAGNVTINNNAAAGGHFAAPTASSVLVVSGVITSSVAVVQRLGTVRFSGGGTGYTAFTNSADTTQIGANNGLATTATVTIGVSAAGSLDLNGYNQTLVGILKGASYAATIGNSSTTANSILTITGTSSWAGIIQDVLGSGTMKTGLTVAGGALTLTAANTYTGATTVTSGTLALGAANRLADASALTVTGGTFDLGTFAETVAAVSITGGTIANGTLTGASYDLQNGTVSAILAGSSITATKTTAGTVTLSGANTYTGLTTVSNGTLALGAANRLADTSALTVTGGTFDLGTFTETVAAVSITGGTIANGTLTGASYDLQAGTVSAILAGSSITATKTTGGTVTLSGANTYTGLTTISNGTLQVGSGTTGTLGSGAVTNNATLSFGRTNSSTVANAISGSGSLVQDGVGGTTILTGTNSYGTTTITNGTLQVGSGTTGTLGSGAVTNNATLSFGRTNSSTVANAISGSGSLVQDGVGGTTILTGTNSYGTTTITNGTLQVGSGGTTGSLGSGAVSNNGILVINRSNAYAVSNAISGAGSLTQSGAGVLTLSGDNSFSGGTTVSAGTVRAGHDNAFGNLAAHALALNAGTLTSDGGTARAFANNVTIGGNITLGATTTNTGDLTFNGTVGLGAAARTITANSNLTFTGGVSSTDQNLTIGGAGNVTISTLALNLGTGTLTMNGSGTLLLSVANTFAGATINSGTVQIGNAGSLSGTITLVSGATLDLNGFAVSNTIVLAEGATLTGGSITASTAPTIGTVNTVLAGIGATLAKTDNGRLVLAGANTYTGVTSIAGSGTIAVASFGDGGVSSSPLGFTALNDPDKLVIGSGTTLEFTGLSDVSTERSFTVATTAGVGGTIAATGTGALTFSETSIIKLTGTNPRLRLSAGNASAVNFFDATLDSSLGLDSPVIDTLIIDGVGQWVIGSSATNRFKNTASISVGAGATLGFESGSLGDSSYSGSIIALAGGAGLRWSGTNTDDISARLVVPFGATVKLDTGSNVVTFESSPVMAPGSSLSVIGGKLIINSTVAGNVGVSTGATLGGDGTVGTVIMATGSHLSPGKSPGTINMANLTLAAGAIIDWQVQDALDFTGPQLGFDTIHITGSLDLSADYSLNRVKIRVISLLGTEKGGNGTITGKPDDFNNADTVGMVPRIFNFMRIEGTPIYAVGKSITDVFEFDLSQFQYSNDGSNNLGLWSISEYIDNVSGDTYIRITAVPEPSTYGFGLGALALAAAAIRRRRKNQPKV
jgi:autotransporter-associated beta strand protein